MEKVCVVQVDNKSAPREIRKDVEPSTWGFGACAYDYGSTNMETVCINVASFCQTDDNIWS